MSIGHPRLATLRAYDDGTPIPRVRRHLTRCPRCRQRLTDIRGIRDGMETLTAPAPDARLWERIAASLDGGETVILPDGGSPVAGRPDRRFLRAAVLVLLGAAGGISATVFGAPLVNRLVSGGAVEETPVAPTPVRTTGVAVPMGESGARVRVESPAPDLRLHIQLTDGALLEVEARGEASVGVFRPSGSTVTVVGPGSGELWIGVPRGDAPFALEVDGREVLTSDGRHLRVPGAAVPPGDAEVRLRVPTGEGGLP